MKNLNLSNRSSFLNGVGLAFATFAAFAGLSVFVAADFAKADISLIDDQQFVRVITGAQSACRSNHDCKLNGLRFEVVYDGRNLNPAISPFMRRFQEIAEDQAMIWGDTILEGPYGADGRTHIDGIAAVYRGNELVAYRIVYSENAWIVGDNGERNVQGRITEASYVSPNLTDWFRDLWSLAIFH